MPGLARRGYKLALISRQRPDALLGVLNQLGRVTVVKELASFSYIVDTEVASIHTVKSLVGDMSVALLRIGLPCKAYIYGYASC
jgi:hypothetical protein